jgi:hypothetical protein
MRKKYFAAALAFVLLLSDRQAIADTKKIRSIELSVKILFSDPQPGDAVRVGFRCNDRIRLYGYLMNGSLVESAYPNHFLPGSEIFVYPFEVVEGARCTISVNDIGVKGDVSVDGVPIVPDQVFRSDGHYSVRLPELSMEKNLALQVTATPEKRFVRDVAPAGFGSFQLTKNLANLNPAMGSWAANVTSCSDAVRKFSGPVPWAGEPLFSGSEGFFAQSGAKCTVSLSSSSGVDVRKMLVFRNGVKLPIVGEPANASFELGLEGDTHLSIFQLKEPALDIPPTTFAPAPTPKSKRTCARITRKGKKTTVVVIPC